MRLSWCEVDPRPGRSNALNFGSPGLARVYGLRHRDGAGGHDFASLQRCVIWLSGQHRRQISRHGEWTAE